MSGVGAAVVLAAVTVTTLAAWWLRTRNGAVRAVEGGEDVSPSGVSSSEAMFHVKHFVQYFTIFGEVAGVDCAVLLGVRSRTGS